MVAASSKLYSGTSSGDELAKSVHEVVRSLFRDIQPTVEAERLSLAQFWAMHVLSSMHPKSVSAVARHLGVSAPTTCVTIDQLEAAGLVTRQRSVRDHRFVDLALTQEGHRVEARVWSRIGRRISEAVRDLPPDDVAKAVQVFRELSRRLDATPADQGENP
jgi:MarR family transcriptional regulator, organic hydroperoxide resistance regulator